MSTLKQKSQAILNEKTSKIIPSNIKEGVQIFDVTGTYVINKTVNDGFFLSSQNIENNSVNCPLSIVAIKCYEYLWASMYTTVYTLLVYNDTNNYIDMAPYYNTLQFDFYDSDDNLIYSSSNCFRTGYSI